MLNAGPKGRGLVVTIVASRPELIPSLVIVLTGGIWGTYWIPLRRLEGLGLSGAWTTVTVIAISALLLAPVVARRWRRLRAGRARLLLAGFLVGSPFALYSNAYVFTDVINVVLLFYLTPIWSAILSRIFLREHVVAVRVLAIALGIAGMGIILGADGGIPLPRNLGDWLSFGSGVLWAAGSVVLRQRPEVGAFENGFAFFVGALPMTLLVPLLFIPDFVDALPAAAQWPGFLPWLLPATLFWTLITMVALLWAMAGLSPVRVGILLMSEAVVGVVSAAILTDEPFGWRQILGGCMILGAGFLEVARPQLPGLIGGRRTSARSLTPL
jgi:drug/metabolite transporter (DMT)-like permease